MRIKTGITAPVTALALIFSTAAYAQSQGATGSDNGTSSELEDTVDNAEAPATGGQGNEASSNGSSDMAQSGDNGTAEGGSADPERLIVTVDDTEITQGDVMAMIAAMPQEMRQQPQERLVPMAVQQLIMRQMLLDAAEADGLSEDEDVQTMTEENEQMQNEDAMVRVYLQRELDSAVTDDAVQNTYDEIAANSETELPPLEDVRPQIEQQVRQQAYGELQADLQEGTRIVFYGPDGEPTSASTGGTENSDS